MSMQVLEIAWQEAKEDFQRKHTTPYIWDNPRRMGNRSELFARISFCN